MFCPHCGTENKDDAVFCENCGADISKEFSEAQSKKNDVRSDAVSYAPPPNPNAARKYVYQSGGAAVAAKPRTPMKTSTKVFLIVLAALVVACVALYNVAKQKNSPEQYALTYFGAIRDKDWAKAYSFLDIAENDFINEANFKKVMGQAGSGQKIVNYSIVKEKDHTAKNNATAELTKTITIQYTVQGGTEPQTAQVTLIKQPQKELFFDTWKVSPSDYITQEVYISVPQEAKAYLDNIEIPKADQVEDAVQADSSADESEGQEDQGDQDSQGDPENQLLDYKIDSIFSGSHVLKVTSPYTEDYTENITADGSEINIQVTDLKVKQSILDQVSKQAQDTVQKIYASAVAGDGFDSIQDLFVPDDDVQNNQSENYQILLGDMATGDHSNDGFKTISPSDFKMQVYESGLNSSFYVSLTLDFDYSYTAVSTNSYDPEESPTQLSDTGTGEISMTYVLTDGKWLIQDASTFDLNRNYY